MNPNNMVNVRWLVIGRKGNEEQTFPTYEKAIEFTNLLTDDDTTSAVLHLRPVEGAMVSFNQGVERIGKVTKVGPKRTTIAFTYKNGRAGEVAIPHDYLVKNNFGWEAVGWHKTPSLRSTPGQYRSTLR